MAALPTELGSNAHSSIEPVHRFSRATTADEYSICQWFVTKIAAAITQAPMMIDIGAPMEPNMCPSARLASRFGCLIQTGPLPLTGGGIDYGLMSFNRFGRSANDDREGKGDEDDSVFHDRVPL